MFKVGDSVVYPAHGLAQIDSIESKKIGGQEEDFYILKILKKNLSVMVPTKNEEKIGLRSVIREKDVEKVFRILSQPADAKHTQWHHRYGDNIEKLKSGSIFQAAEVVRDLAALNRRKNLAIKETRMMENARSLIISEIAYAISAKEREVEDWVNGLLSGDRANTYIPIKDLVATH